MESLSLTAPTLITALLTVFSEPLDNKQDVEMAFLACVPLALLVIFMIYSRVQTPVARVRGRTNKVADEETGSSPGTAVRLGFCVYV